ncbi:F-box only protein 6 [Physcomitrium patens]|uniref:F-box domain-containing protein n=1 Tax=Physcomitrium patens TaxID=3218 RepID=A0A2K1J9V9_PHYPA|nr:F-box only protein 6-like [Physcomitrium patens]PNR38299.1 hypothetical protein PHYPA_021410 [Physcomitrium patens]|eukprot:XP_024398239.1 F-box only protein 6-like [Physcomitrella patens]
MMDPEVWSKLPQEMLLDVLARLPYNRITKFREVCKKWKELLNAKHFTDRIVSIRKSQTPLLVVCVKRYHAIMAYDPTIKEWQEIFIWKKPPNFQIHCLRAAGGGLLCFKGNLGERKTVDEGATRLLVVNPITKLWRILPSLPSGIRAAGCVNLVVLENEPNRFKILFMQIHCNLHQRRLVGTLYDSAADLWTTYCEDTTLESVYRSVYVNGTMHYIGSERVHEYGALVSRRQGVSFDMYKKAFSRFDAPLTSEVGAKKFMELHGRLSLVTFSTVATFSPSVQQFDEQSGTWVDAQLLPPGIGLGVQGYVPLGQGSYLYFADPHRQSETVVCYDLLNRQRFLIDESFPDLRSEGFKLYHPTLCSV